MRFAGTATSSYAGTPRIESFMDSFGPDMGEIAMAGDNIRSKESQFGTKLKGDTTARGISAAGKVEASEIEGSRTWTGTKQCFTSIQQLWVELVTSSVVDWEPFLQQVQWWR